MKITDTFQIKGRGVVICVQNGWLYPGKMKVGNKLKITNPDGTSYEGKLSGIEMVHYLTYPTVPSTDVNLMISGILKEEIQQNAELEILPDVV